MVIPWEILAAFLFLSLKSDFLPDRAPWMDAGLLLPAMIFAYPFLTAIIAYFAGGLLRQKSRRTRFSKIWLRIPLERERVFSILLSLPGYFLLLTVGRWHDYCVVLLGSDGMGEVAALLPFVASVALSWNSVIRRLGLLSASGAPISPSFFRSDVSFRETQLSSWFRFSLAFLALITLIVLAGSFLDRVPERYSLFANLLFLPAMVLLLAWVLPRGIVTVLGAHRLVDGPKRAMIETALESWKIRIGDIYIWPTAPFRIPNAAVVGAFPRTRIILLTDSVLGDFPDEELLGILAHEIGHFRHRHLYLLSAIVLLFTLFSHALMTRLMGPNPAISRFLIGFSTPSVSAGKSVEPSWFSFFLGVVIVGGWFWILWFGVIGFFSRRYEQQADLTSVELLGTGMPLARALSRIVGITGIDPTAPDLRHGNLQSRIERLTMATPDTAREYSSTLRRLSAMTLIALILAWLAVTLL